ncbi:hypothetical protein HDU93_006863 [Gonapodya sp. JEL0774]|nr:hypothetical protein HDU93_006863 [Gonapodya sp. JEL0774]
MLPIAEFFKLITSALEKNAADGSADARNDGTALVTGIPGAWKTTRVQPHLSTLASPTGREDAPRPTSAVPDSGQSALVTPLDGAGPSQPADVAPAREYILDHTEHWQTAILPNFTGLLNAEPIAHQLPLPVLPPAGANIPKDVTPKTSISELAKIPDVWEIKESDLICSVSEVLGKGGYGVVYCGKWLNDIDVAVKVITFAKGYDMKMRGVFSYAVTGTHIADLLQSFDDEATTWYNLTSQHVLRLYGIVKRGNMFAFVSPILEYGSVPKYLERFNGDEYLRRAEVLLLLLDIARGLEYLHSLNIVHADLSPDNALVDRRKHAVLTDFGTSKVLSAGTFDATGGRVGKARYMSPERLRGEGTTKADDSYAFGMLMYSRPPAEIDSVPEADLIGDAEYLWTLADGFHHGRQGREQNLDKASQVYLRAAEFGHVEAMHQLYFFYKNGLGILPKNSESAFKWCQRAAEHGNLQAQFDLGDCFYFGQGHAIDHKEAVKWWRKAAEQGSVQAQYNLGVMYANGQGVQKDEAEEVKWYRRAADQGYAPAQYNLGFMYANGQGVQKDEAEAVKLYRRAADQGDAMAQYNLGVMYANGQGVQKDEAEAVKWHMRAADQGDADAQVGLGVMYRKGRGVQKDEAVAVKWYRRAADRGHVPAQSNLGLMYQNGWGVHKDEAEAVKWYRKAADQGDAMGQNNLGWMYVSGQGASRDVHEARKLFTAAGEQGDAWAQFNLAYLFHFHGLGGCERDVGMAEELFTRSGDGEHDWALGILHERGAKDEQKAVDYYLKDLRCMAKTLLAAMYKDGRGGLDQDLAAAVRLYTEALEEGDVVAAVGLGRMYEKGLGGLPKDISKAIEMYEMAGTWEARSALERLRGS